MKNYFRPMTFFLSGLIFLSGLTTLGADNSDVDLEEAAGLGDDAQMSKATPVSAETATSYSQSSWFNSGRTRTYLLIDGTQTSGGTNDQIYFPNGQLNFFGDFKILNESFLIIDAAWTYDDKEKESSLFLNQVGFRSRLSESVQYFIGKERNRRSPGLMVSPSDFIYSNTNLPGQREDRKGVWLGRLSYQKINGSIDFLILPVQSETLEGLPDSKQNSNEGAIRGLYQFSGIDVSLIVGRYFGTNRAGTSVQTLLLNKYKMYVELGTQEEATRYNNTKKDYPVQSLAGFGYEGSEDFSARLEYFENGQGLNSDEFNQMMQLRSLFPSQFAGNTNLQSPFIRQKYLITSVTFPEIKKKYNFTISGIKSLEDDSLLGITRLEYLATDNLLVGLSFTKIQGGTGSQYQYRNFDTQATADLKYSF
ncbi:MAG: hypothetical protein BroJett040_18850 [Oligoflexia bacterium]|jgi:hypothetical protein|nr:MAG: hypothetical protein BroJett040_18850 [Oligoflexia bacterium]